MSIIELYNIYKEFPSVQTDSRKLRKGDIFFALKGTNFNGNTFAKKALEDGAAFAIVDEPAYRVSDKIILVENVLTVLQQLAKYHRHQLSIPVIAITGSNGKTTTKELVHAVLSASFITYTTEGNLNNHIGVPLTLLKIKDDAEMAVIEMGANHQKEIASYCQYAQPTHGLITNCGKAHLEGFGGVEGVKKGKGELYDYLRNNNGTTFIMREYDYLLEMSKGIEKTYTYGISDADIEGKMINADPYLSVEISKGASTGIIQTQLAGDYNLPNVLAAVAIGKYFSVDDKKIKSALENYQPANNRSQLLEKGSNKIILDAYNANPSSMKLAIENFSKLKAENKVLVLGAMAELGDESRAEHDSLINLIQQFSWKAVVLVGDVFKNTTNSYDSFQHVDEAKKWFQEQKFENTYLLIKGSRSIQLEKILEP